MYIRKENLLLSEQTLVNHAVYLYLFYHMYFGLFDKIREGDSTKITFIIIAITVFSIIVSTFKGIKLNYYLKLVKKGKEKTHEVIKMITGSDDFDKNDPIHRKNLEISLYDNLQLLRYLAMTLPLLGLIGTIFGFILILSISPENLLNIKTENIPEIVVHLFSSLGIALYTTLAGALGYLWVSYNLHILQRASSQLFNYLIKNS